MKKSPSFHLPGSCTPWNPADPTATEPPSHRGKATEPPSHRATDAAMPRPKKSATEKQDNIVKLSLSSELHQQLLQRAKAVHMPLASYCRQLLEGSKPPAFIPELNYQTFRELGRPLSNLNQLLKLLRFIKAQHHDIPTSVFELLEEELTELRRLRLRAIDTPEIVEMAHPLEDGTNTETPDQVGAA